MGVRVLARSELRKIDGPGKLERFVRVLRQGEPSNGHVFYVGTRMGLLGAQDHLPADRQAEALERAALVDGAATLDAADPQFVSRLEALDVALIVLNQGIETAGAQRIAH